MSAFSGYWGCYWDLNPDDERPLKCADRTLCRKAAQQNRRYYEAASTHREATHSKRSRQRWRYQKRLNNGI